MKKGKIGLEEGESGSEGRKKRRDEGAGWEVMWTCRDGKKGGRKGSDRDG